MAKKRNTRVKPHLAISPIKATLSEKKTALDVLNSRLLVISFLHLDREQGDKFEDWQEEGILSKAMNTLRDYCCDKMPGVNDSKFTVYGDFPSEDKTGYERPTHTPRDANWARIHVTGKQCIIGHVVGNVFYVVFLDGKHLFWKTKRQRGD